MIIKTTLFTLLFISFMFLHSCGSCLDFGNDNDSDTAPDSNTTIDYDLSVTVKGSVDIEKINEKNGISPLPIPIGDSAVEIKSDNLVVASIIQRSDLVLRSDLIGRSDFFKNNSIDENSSSVLSHTVVATDGSFNLQVPTGVMFYMVVAYKEDTPQFHFKPIKREEKASETLLIDTGEPIYPLGKINSSTASGENAMLTIPQNTDLTIVDVGLCSLGANGFGSEISMFSFFDRDGDGIPDDVDPDIDGNGTTDSEEIVDILVDENNSSIVKVTAKKEISYTITLSQQKTSVTYYTSIPSSCSFVDKGDSTGTLTCNFSTIGSFQASFIAKFKEVTLLSLLGAGKEKYTYAYADYILSVVASNEADDGSDEEGDDDSAADSGDGSDASTPEYATLSASDAASNANFGESLAIDGSYAIVGGVNSSNNGSVYIFNYSELSWSEQTKLSVSDGFSGDGFGNGVSIDSTQKLAVAGASGSFSTSGSAYVFSLIGSSWSQNAKLTGSDSVVGDQFGTSVSISGDTIIVGATQNNSSSKGAAYVFIKNGSNWDEQAKLIASDGAQFDEFGSSVGISGDYVIVAANDNVSAYIFKRDTGVWSEQKILTKADDSGFGRSVAIDGDYAIVGGYGAAHVYLRSGTEWNLQATLSTDGISSSSVGIKGDYAIVGASGKAHVFKRTDTSWSKVDEKNHGGSESGFGFSVAITSGYYIIGNPYKKISSKSNAGAAYIYPF